MIDLAIARVVEMRPSILISGFLGAGKTTLLRHLLKHLKTNDIKADVILNDYANAMIDSETLREDSESIEALGASCACCEGMDFLIEMVIKATESDNDILLTELNGTADPLPIVESFTLLENKFKLFPRWHVCVIDARHFEERSYHNRLERDQLETASHYLISHQEEVSTERLANIRLRLKEILPAASFVTEEELASQVLSLALAKKKCILNATNDAASNPPSKSPYHHLSHEITACQILFPQRVKIEKIKPWLKSLPDHVMRAKGLFDLTDDLQKRYLYERVGKDIPDTPYPVSLKSTVPSSAILIGPELNPSQLLEHAQATLLPEAQLSS
ncbi:GTP-binding protein [Rubritalea tangerina]|uniref:GTP-binding protein n=1 Tax=Rubritalea tangerina TaxID=430798 RepID=A0ABW4ZDR3_9BACT